MLRSLWLLFLYGAFLGLGTAAPFIATLGYVWVDTFQPQTIAYIILNQIPVALIMAIAAFATYILTDRRAPPRLTLQTVLHLVMTVWVTATLAWAVAPAFALDKWDPVIKTLLFSAFVPLVIRSRVQIEAFAQTYVLSLAANFVSFGVKVLISGGGYGVNLGLQAGNSGLSEGGLLSTTCLMATPLALFLARHGCLLPNSVVIRAGYLGLAVLAVVTALGTYERSALLGLVVLAAYSWIRTKHKIGFGLLIAVVGCLVFYKMSASWADRVATIGTFQTEDSALVRVLVWKWTLGFVMAHPLGGGFNAYIVDEVEVPEHDGVAGYVQTGRAFHSIYFEVLGEHGFVGILIFLLLALTSLLKLRRIARQARAYPELAWMVALSDALQVGLAAFLTAGAFVGIAFQPMFWYFVALTVSLDAYRVRVFRAGSAETGGRLAAPATGRPAPGSPVPGWRDRAALAKAAGLSRPASSPVR